jgi:hypothetical protein
MNPYLEQDDAWHDFHESFLPLARELLEAQVGPAYIVKIEPHLYIHDAPENGRRFAGIGDVGVAQQAPSAQRSSGTAVLEAPLEVFLPAEEVERESFVEIRDRRNRQLITVLEMLSPSNKRLGPDRDQYLTKRRELLTSSAHLVEIDLLRGYARMPLEQWPDCAYGVLVSRAEDRRRAKLWPVQLRKRLPVVPVPLRAPDPDARLDLQAMLHRLYDAANYGKYIYESEPEPALAPEDAAWARQFVPPAA